MSRTIRTALLLTAAAAVSLPSVAEAHPGHGRTGPETVLHYLAEPLHMVWMLGAVAAGVMLYRARRVLRSLPRRQRPGGPRQR